MNFLRLKTEMVVSWTDMNLHRSLLNPIGEYRSKYVIPSKGKRKKKQKREQTCAGTGQTSADYDGETLKDGIPAPPEVLKGLTLGFNSTTKYLENLAHRLSSSSDHSQSLMKNVATNTGVTTVLPRETASSRPMAAVFVPHADKSTTLYRHIPLLIKRASLISPGLPSTRLVMLPQGVEQRLGRALSIPRVGLLGLLSDEPESAALIEFVMLNVPEIQVPWLHEATGGAYLPVKINAMTTSAITESYAKGNSSSSTVSRGKNQ